MSAATASQLAGSQAAAQWERIAAHAPRMADTLGRYLAQVGTFLAPRSVEAAEVTLRHLACWLLETQPIRTVAGVARDDIEDYKVWLADQPGVAGDGLSSNTQRQRLRTLRALFERIIEWDWPDAPARNPILGRDLPPLPKFLDDRAPPG